MAGDSSVDFMESQPASAAVPSMAARIVVRLFIRFISSPKRIFLYQESARGPDPGSRSDSPDHQPFSELHPHTRAIGTTHGVVVRRVDARKEAGRPRRILVEQVID